MATTAERSTLFSGGRDEARRGVTAAASGASLVFTTADVPLSQRLDAWNGAFGSLNEIMLPGEAAGELIMRTENWRLGGMLLSVTSVPDSRFVRDAHRARRDGLDHWVIRVLRRGRSHVQHPGFAAWVGARQPLLFSMHETWAVEWQAAEWVTLCIPRDHHPQLDAVLGTLRGGPLQGACAGLLADLLLSLPERVMAADAGEFQGLADTTRAAVAACAMALGPQAGEATTAIGVLQKERVRKVIQSQIGSARLTPGRLAGAAGLSRSALYRLFAEEGGVARYVRDVRLSLAHAALRDPQQAGRSIAEVAEAHGFPDPSAFSRAFRQAFGATPGEVRASGLPGPAPGRRWQALRPANDAANFAARLYGTG